MLAGLTSIKGQTLEARVFSGIFPSCCVEIRELLGEERQALADGLSKSKEAVEDGKGENGVKSQATDSTTDGDDAQKEKETRRKTDVGSETPGIPVNKLASGKGLRLTQRMSSATALSEALPPSTDPVPPVPILPTGSARDPDAPRPPAPVPMLKVGDETQTSLQEPLVDEIASCLREWYTAKLHELLLARQYTELDKMSVLVQRLDTSRRQLLHRVLTDQELRALRESTVWDLVNGNKMLCGEVIVRSPSQRGRLLTADDSPIEVTKLQSMMSLLSEKPTNPTDEHIPHHLLVDFPHPFGELESPKTIAAHLFSKAQGGAITPISEVHAINLSTSNGSSSEGNMKTLFVDIGSSDLGEGAGSGSKLYVAFKVIVNENLRTTNALGYNRDSSSDVTDRHGSLKGGRRSLMWGKQNANTPKSPELKQEEAPNPRPGTKSEKLVKRTVAVAILRVDQTIKQDVEVEQELIFWTPSTFSEDGADTDKNWNQVIRDIVPSHTGEYNKYSFPKPVKVFVKPFLDPDSDALVKKTPTLLQNISQTRRIGFIGAPSKPRSDIYLTLTEAILPRQAFLSHPKSGAVPLGTQGGLANLQLTLEVRRSNGQRIENCIYPSCNSQGHTAWRTTACERGEPWNLTIRLAISPEDVPGSHIVMSIADLPGFPFALCWMPLWNDGAFIPDGSHFLSLYQYDEYTSSIISGRGAYLGLPWAATKREDNAAMANLAVKTYLCSTKYSQDPTLLGLLKWKSQPAGSLPSLLRRFAFVPEIEVVKLLFDVFDALFEILVDCAGSEEYENQVFHDLVFVLGIVYDRRFRLAPLVDQYAESRLKYPVAALCIVRTFIRLLATPTDSDTSQKLRGTFKVAQHLFRFVGVAWQQQEIIDKEQNKGHRRKSQFLKDVRDIFASLESLMKNPNPSLVGTKTLLVQHFHSWLPELMAFMSPKEILETAISFVDSCKMVTGQLILYKLVLIIQLSELEAINLPETKQRLRLYTVRWLAPYWGKEEMVTPLWRDQVRLCCSVVATQLGELGEEGSEYFPKLVDSYRAIQMSERQSKKDLSLLFPTVYPFPKRPIATPHTDSNFDEALVEIAAVMAGITSLPSTLHIDMETNELAEFLFSALQVYISILDGEAFPQSWLSVFIYHHKATMRSLEKLSSILIDSFLPHPDDAEQFNTELWKTFFEALLKLVGSDALALETFPEQKRRAVWKIAGDVREQGAELIRGAWEAIGWETSPEDKSKYGLEKLGGYQVQYVPGLVGPIMELCLTVHDSLRRVAIQILQTMIISEWTLSSDLGLIQAEIIDCLDKLFRYKQSHNESILQKQFIGELLEAFNSLQADADEELLEAVKSLVGTIDVLLDLLIAVHASDVSSEAMRLMETLHLMEFLRDMQRVDRFIGYVHQLANVQAQAKNYVEAGLALRLHADLYDWDPITVLEPLDDPGFPAQTPFERKEQLYFRMIKLYEEGQSWDNALASYMELADQYEQFTFDFLKLARAQRAMATIYESIARGQRSNPRYFRVAFSGFGFPPSLRDKQFIYAGLPTDRMAGFVDRIQSMFPNSVVSPGGYNGEKDLERQYVGIWPVSPMRDLGHPIWRRGLVEQSVREYYLLSRPKMFVSSSRRKHSAAGDPKEVQVVEKSVYTTSEAFPTVLKKSEIVDVGTVSLTPLQQAIERTTRKTSELLTLERRVREGEGENAHNSLVEAVAAAVDEEAGSVARYRSMLAPPPKDEDEEDKDSEKDREDSAADEDEDEEDEDEPKPLDPLQEALKIALVDHAIAVRRCLMHFNRPAQRATGADLNARKFSLRLLQNDDILIAQ